MASRDWLNRNVAGMAFTSLLSDVCYEMIISVLPGFLAAVGISPAALGWIEGAADALSSFLKLWAGWYSDRIGRRKLIVVIGYFFTGSGMSLFALAAKVSEGPCVIPFCPSLFPRRLAEELSAFIEPRTPWAP
jgi:MFS family permease